MLSPGTASLPRSTVGQAAGAVVASVPYALVWHWLASFFTFFDDSKAE